MLRTPHFCLFVHGLFDSSNYFVKSRDYEHAHNIVFFVPLLPSLLTPDIHSTLISNTLSLSSSLLVRPGFTPIKTTIKANYVCILIFTFLGSELFGR